MTKHKMINEDPQQRVQWTHALIKVIRKALIAWGHRRSHHRDDPATFPL
jgi:hypothetical protein